MADLDSLDTNTIMQEYTSKTANLTGYLQKKIESTNAWQNIPGNLTKIASSPAGWVWGYDKSNVVYVCKEPCTGGWQSVDTSVLNVQNIQDIAVDKDNVYILYSFLNAPSGEGAWAFRPVDGSGAWSGYPTTPAFTTIVPTNNYLWATTSTFPMRCAKPCTTNNWVEDTLPDGLTMLGSDGASVYGAPYGLPNLWKRDEQGQQNWTPVPSVNFMPTSLAAESSANGLYVADPKGSLNFCTDTSCNTVDTLGYAVPTLKGGLSKNPDTQKLWLLSTTTGVKGNVFERLDSANIAPIMREVESEEASRGELVNTLADALQVQTSKAEASMVAREASAAIQQLEPVSKSASTSQKTTQTIKREIANAQSEGEGYTGKLVPLQILTGTLLVSILLYLTVGFIMPTTLTNVSVFLVLAAGLGAAIYFSVKGNADGQRFIQSIFPTPK